MTTAAGLLGGDNYGPAEIGTDILAKMGIADLGATDFTPPLGAGDYAVWIQETDPGSFAYHFDFVLAAVPEPASGAVVLTGLALLGMLRRHRRSQLPAIR